MLIVMGTNEFICLSVLHLGRLNLRTDGSSFFSELSGWLGSTRICSAYFRVRALSRVRRSLRFMLVIMQHSFTTHCSLVLLLTETALHQQRKEKVRILSIKQQQNILIKVWSTLKFLSFLRDRKKVNKE